MKLEELAIKVIEAAESARVEFLTVGAIAAGAYGVPWSTRDVDVVVSLETPNAICSVIEQLDSIVKFESQVQFDTITWVKRHVGRSRSEPPFKVELFEKSDDAFVHSEFQRRQSVLVPQLGRATWLPTPEDVIVQNLRWGRGKDLDDARDVRAVQDPANLEMDYIRRWCATHETTERLERILSEIPPM